MIDWRRLHDYCNGDYTQIENYEKALNDKENVWVCHHRNGILLNKSAEELDAMGLYKNRPPEELMFLTKGEHMTLHNLGERNPMYGKNAEDYMTAEAVLNKREKYSKSMQGKNKDKHHYNNGVIGVFTYECPEGFVPGLLIKDPEKARRNISKALKGQKKNKPAWNKGIKTGKPAWNRGIKTGKPAHNKDKKRYFNEETQKYYYK